MTQSQQRPRLDTKSILPLTWGIIVAIIIDALVLHVGLEPLGFDVPENAEYFVSKMAVIAVSFLVIAKLFGSKTGRWSGLWEQALACGLLGSLVFSLYYTVTRPDSLGLFDDVFDYSYPGYEPPMLTLEQAITIFIVHAFGIAIGYGVFMWILKRRR